MPVFPDETALQTYRVDPNGLPSASASCPNLRGAMFNEDASVTRLCYELRSGDSDAATDLWKLCCQSLVREARHQLGPKNRRASDEEDVALAVFQELCSGVAEGRLGENLHRDDLIRLLRHFTRHEVLDQRRHAQRVRRGGGTVRGDSIFAFSSSPTEREQGFHSIPSPDPAPDLLIQLEDQLERLMQLLGDDTLREVAKSCLAGDSRHETAEKLGMSLRSVERKVAIIRETWKDTLDQDS